VPYRDSAFFWVYGLVDPRTNQIFYIGKGRPWRPRRHVWETQCWMRKGSNLDCSGNPLNLHKIRRIAQILKAGMEPRIEVLFRTKSSEAAYRKEKHLVRKLRPQLVNLKNGGAGMRVVPEELRKRIGDGHRGLHHSAETRALISAANKGKKLSSETRAKMSAAVKKRHQECGGRFGVVSHRDPPSAETREKIRKALLGTHLSSAAKAKLSAAGKGRVPSATTRIKQSIARQAWCAAHPAECRAAAQKGSAKRSQSLLGHPVSVETRLKIGKASKGRSASAETRERMRQAQLNQSEETRAKRRSARLGTHLTLETRRKISESNRARWIAIWASGDYRLSEEAVEKIRQSRLGTHLSAETKARISAALKGRPKPPITAETRARMSAAAKMRSRTACEESANDP
jgi:plasmid stability protein